MRPDEDASLRRLSGLVARYQHLGSHLDKCLELMPRDRFTLFDIRRILSISHREMTGFELALAALIEDAMVLHEDLRRSKFKPAAPAQKGVA